MTRRSGMRSRPWAAVLRRKARQRAARSASGSRLNLQLDLHAAALREFASILDRMNANVSNALPSALLTWSATISDRGDSEEHAGHLTLERLADDLEATADDLRRAAAFERDVLNERGHTALLRHSDDSPSTDDEAN